MSLPVTSAISAFDFVSYQIRDWTGTASTTARRSEGIELKPAYSKRAEKNYISQRSQQSIT